MKAVGRFAPVGLAVVLLSLVGFTLWALASIQAAGEQGRTAARANDAFQQARTELAEQHAAQFEYWIERHVAVRNDFSSASQTFLANLALARADAGAGDHAFITGILALHQQYQRAAHRFFATLDQRQGAAAAALERNQLDPLLTRLDQRVDEGAAKEHTEAVAAQNQQVRLERDVRNVSLVVFPIGLMLLALLGWLLRQSERAERVHLEQAALTDAITGLGNHRAFQEQFGREVGRALRHGHALSLALVDLDDFKTVNDRHGHAHGDRVLSIVASVLQGTRGEDRSYRLGGDEFAVILPHTETATATVALERLRLEVENQLFGTTMSIGVAELSKPDADAETLREQADAALYEAKRRGRNTIASFAQIREHASVVSGSKITAVRRLLAERNLTIVFQPIWDLSRDRPFGYEALMRPAPSYQFQGPQEVFDIAERLGRAAELDALCHEAIFARTHELPTDTLLFINLSPQSLDHENLKDSVLLAAVKRAQTSPDRVVFEITERSAVQVETIVRESNRLRGLGFRIALDDVGAGNSGLEVLRHVPVDFVKIDRSLITQALVDNTAYAVLSGILAFARRAGTFVIAEGIETSAMLDIVEQAGLAPTPGEGGLQGAQGYRFGRPSEIIIPGSVEIQGILTLHRDVTHEGAGA